MMSNDRKGNISLAIALIALAISTLALYRRWPAIPQSAMTAATIDGVDATP